MKKSLVIIFSLMVTLQTQAQDYLISFAGSCDTNIVSTVKVDNLTSGATVTLDGSDTLHLYSTDVGIGSPPMDAGSLLLYPNPMTGQSTLTYHAPEGGEALITLFDISGRSICKVSQVVSTGTHSFLVIGISRGLYFVNVRGENYCYTAKLLSQSGNQANPRIEYVSAAINTFDDHLKSAVTQINMPYTQGDQLLFKGMTGIYGTIVADGPASSKTITFNFAACTDADNNNYSIIQIGTQTWMAENLKVGVSIDSTQYQTNNGIIEKYCYDNDTSNCSIYGGLYQWNEMMQYLTTPGVQGICPAGWHIPTDEEWTILTTCLGGEPVAGSKLKSTFGWYNNGNGTNTSGFTILPGGSFDPLFGYFEITYHASFWTSTMGAGPFSWYRYLRYDDAGVNRYTIPLYLHHSCRCLQD